MKKLSVKLLTFGVESTSPLHNRAFDLFAHKLFRCEKITNKKIDDRNEYVMIFMWTVKYYVHGLAKIKMFVRLRIVVESETGSR